MANPGFNIKVRQVENGFTIHVTRVSGEEGEKEEHYDFIAESTEINTSLGSICRQEIEELQSANKPRQR